MTEVSKRDALQALMQEVRADEDTAMADAADFFKSPEAVGFRARIEDFQKRTVPSSPFDQMFGSVLKIFDSMDTMVDKVAQARAEATALADKAEKPVAEPTTSDVKAELEEIQK